MNTQETIKITTENFTTMQDNRFYSKCKENAKKDMLKYKNIVSYFVIALVVIICFVWLEQSNSTLKEKGHELFLACITLLSVIFFIIFIDSDTTDRERLVKYMRGKKSQLSYAISWRNEDISSEYPELSASVVQKKNKKDELKIQKLEFWIKRLEE